MVTRSPPLGFIGIIRRNALPRAERSCCFDASLKYFDQLCAAIFVILEVSWLSRA